MIDKRSLLLLTALFSMVAGYETFHGKGSFVVQSMTSTSHSVCMHVHTPSAYPSGRQWLMNLGQHTQYAHHWIWNSATMIQFGGWSSGTQIQSPSLPTNTDMMLATTYDGSTYSFYIDGILQASTPSAHFIFNNYNLNIADGIEINFAGSIYTTYVFPHAISTICTKTVDCAYTYSAWGGCSVTCGTGTRTRTVIVSQPPGGYPVAGSPCGTDTVQQCSEPECDPCDPSPCGANSICTSGSGGAYTCACAAGYQFPTGGWQQVAYLSGTAAGTTGATGDSTQFAYSPSKLSDADINALNWSLLKFEPENSAYPTTYFNMAGLTFASNTPRSACSTPYTTSEADAFAGSFSTGTCTYNVCNFGRSHYPGNVHSAFGYQSYGGCGSAPVVGTSGVVHGAVRIYVFVGQQNTGDCVDVDECAASPCDANAECTNTAGGYACACLPGFSGDGFTCTDVNECAGSPCQNGGICNNLVNAYSCSCAAGFEGTNCEININECASSPCTLR
eukprot:TRINITY_DN9814_c0_g1_i1.p1 TRINITY_DN9814_c0_g1~~TRINITY_DN9814_c0_g1_i1.p1  ORF type:complete len:503 (+),score=68.05 TRINITY_DN9814_c0_g1_i1:46-1554(+)